MKKTKIFGLFLLMFSFAFNSFAWEELDKVVATVNGEPIIESELDLALSRDPKGSKLKGSAREKYKKKFIKQVINHKIIEQVAEAESITISQQRVDERVSEMMKQFGIASEKEFAKQIKKAQGLSLAQYKEEIRMMMLKEQVMQIVIGFTPPSASEVNNWYKKNKSKLGFEVKFRHILIRPKGNSFSAEKAASQKITELSTRIKRGESFAKLARQYSADKGSAVNGGLIEWVNIGELDPYFAQAVFQMRKKGQISAPVKSSFGYHLIQYLGRRDVPFEKYENRIYQIVAQQKMGKEFDKWLERKRLQSDIKIMINK